VPSAFPDYATIPGVDKLAADLMNGLRNSALGREGKLKPIVLVFPRPNSPLNRAIASALASSLVHKEKIYEIFNEAQLKCLGISEQPKPGELLEANSLLAAARKFGVKLVISGKYSKVNRTVKLEVHASRFATGERLCEANNRIPLPREWQGLDSHAAPDTLARDTPPCFDEQPLPPGVERPGKNGVNYPECVYCPDPHFTQQARDAKFDGTMTLQLTINADGTAGNISILKGLPFGLNEEGLKAIKGWRFKPAKNREGNPVPVQIILEMTFRLP